MKHLVLVFGSGLLAGGILDQVMTSPTVLARHVDSTFPSVPSSAKPHSHHQEIEKNPTRISQTTHSAAPDHYLQSESELDHVLGRLEAVSKGTASLSSLSGIDWESLAPLIAQRQPQQTLELALSLPTGYATQRLCVEAFRVLAVKNGPHAWKQLERLGPGTMEREATVAVLETWAMTHPGAATRGALELGFNHREHLSAVASGWAKVDPHSALSWAAKADASVRDAILEEALRGAIINITANNQEIGTLLNFSNDPALRAKAASAIAIELGSIDDDSAFRWANTLKGYERESAICGLAQEIAGTSPEAAAQALSHLVLSSSFVPSATDHIDHSIAKVAKAFAEVDAAAAISWAHALPRKFGDEAMRLAISSWAERDLSAASIWLSRQKQDPMLEAARLAFAASAADFDPSCALSWARICAVSPERDLLIEQLRLRQQ